MKCDKTGAKLIQDVLRWRGPPIVAVCRILDTCKNASSTCRASDFLHCIVQKVGLFDLEFVRSLQAIKLIRFFQGSQGNWDCNAQLLELREPSFSGLAGRSTRGCNPNSCNVVSLGLQEVAQLVNLNGILKFENANCDTARSLMAMVNWAPASLRATANASLRATSQNSHSPHFDASLRATANASLRATHAASAAKFQWIWVVGWLPRWEAIILSLVLLHHDLTQPFRVWLGGGEGSHYFIMTWLSHLGFGVGGWGGVIELHHDLTLPFRVWGGGVGKGHTTSSWLGSAI